MAGQIRETLIEVDDADFYAGLDRAMEELQIRTAAGLERFAIGVANRAKEMCPVDTGRLRGAIGTQPGKDAEGPYVDVGVINTSGEAVDYGPYVEFGTSKMRAQPFMRPALAEAAGYFGESVAGGDAPASLTSAA